MDIAKDICDKYTTEQIVAYLDKVVAGVLKNYKTSLEQGNSSVLWGSLGDIAQMRAILHEMDKRNRERAAAKEL